MKGSIFKLFESYVVEVHGAAAFEDLLDATDLETDGPFVGPGTYPPGDLVALLTTASMHTGRSVDDLLRGFGRYAFAFLAATIPTLMEGLDDPRSLLFDLEHVIHTEVRKLYPDASPPRFVVTETGPGELTLRYESGLGLFALVEGLLDGLGDWYGTVVDHRRVCVDGTDAVFAVRVGGPVSEPSEETPAENRSAGQGRQSVLR
jgi:hypothetical protein